MGYKKIYFKISKEAYDLVKKRGATISSGGVRLKDGTLKELAKPIGENVIKKVKDKISDGIDGVLGKINIVSSAACNVQCGVIHKNVKEVNKKLDITIDNLDDMKINISNVLNGINSTNVKLDGITSTVGDISQGVDILTQISQSALSVSVLNVCLTAVSIGIQIYNTKQLKELDKKISAFDLKSDKRELRALISDYNRISETIDYDLKEFCKRPENLLSKLREIHELLAEANALLDRLNTIINDGDLPEEIVLAMLFSLAKKISEELKGYVLLYYCSKGEMLDCNSWIDTFINICQNERFKSILKYQVFSDYPGIPPFQRKEIYDLQSNILLEWVKDPLLTLETARILELKSPSELLLRLQDYIVKSDTYLEDDRGNYYIPLGELAL